MKNLYITHKPAELALAFINAESCAGAFWMAVQVDHIFLTVSLVNIGVLAAVMAWMALFTMRGSRERAEAAQPKEQAHG